MDMAKKRDACRKEPKPQKSKALSRREFFKSGWLAAPDSPKQILGLMFKLLEVGTDGQTPRRHDDPP